MLLPVLIGGLFLAIKRCRLAVDGPLKLLLSVAAVVGVHSAWGHKEVLH